MKSARDRKRGAPGTEEEPSGIRDRDSSLRDVQMGAVSAVSPLIGLPLALMHRGPSRQDLLAEPTLVHLAVSPAPHILLYPLGGCIALRQGTWVLLSQNRWVLQTVAGYCLEFPNIPLTLAHLPATPSGCRPRHTLPSQRYSQKGPSHLSPFQDKFPVNHTRGTKKKKKNGRSSTHPKSKGSQELVKHQQFKMEALAIPGLRFRDN